MDTVSLTLDVYPNGSIRPSFIWPSRDGALSWDELDHLAGVDRLLKHREALTKAVGMAIDQAAQEARENLQRYPLPGNRKPFSWLAE